MIKLYENGVYLLNGTEIVEDTGNVQVPLTKEEAAQNTMAYGILKAHNTSENMERLQIRFDKLTSHDITFVGIIQTARASGLEKFPMPYVLTNCHNSLCAVGGTINEDDQAILGHIGDDMVAANAVAVMVVNIGAIACRGFANATTIIISQELGKDQIDTAGEYGKRMLRITLAVSLIGCVIILAIRPLILDFYRDKLTETALSYLSIFIIMTTWRLVGEGINTCLICGCFRGGGDSRFGMIVDSIFMWLVAVPATFLAAYVFKLPSVWVYFVMTLDEFEKMPVVFIHYFRKKWLTNITRDFD